MSRARGKKAEAIEQSITAFVGMERNSMPSIRYTANFLGASPTCEANCSGQVGAWSLVRFLSRFKRQWCVHGRILLLQWPALPTYEAADLTNTTTWAGFCQGRGHLWLSSSKQINDNGSVDSSCSPQLTSPVPLTS